MLDCQQRRQNRHGSGLLEIPPANEMGGLRAVARKRMRKGGLWLAFDSLVSKEGIIEKFNLFTFGSAPGLGRWLSKDIKTVLTGMSPMKDALFMVVLDLAFSRWMAAMTKFKM